MTKTKQPKTGNPAATERTAAFRKLNVSIEPQFADLLDALLAVTGQKKIDFLRKVVNAQASDYAMDAVRIGIITQEEYTAAMEATSDGTMRGSYAGLALVLREVHMRDPVFIKRLRAENIKSFKTPPEWEQFANDDTFPQWCRDNGMEHCLPDHDAKSKTVSLDSDGRIVATDGVEDQKTDT